jgi:hypothetical protein
MLLFFCAFGVFSVKNKCRSVLIKFNHSNIVMQNKKRSFNKQLRRPQQCIYVINRIFFNVIKLNILCLFMHKFHCEKNSIGYIKSIQKSKNHHLVPLGW